MIREGREAGPWLPTAYLRTFRGALQQKFRRRVKHYTATARGFGARSHVTYEYEWQGIPAEEEVYEK